MPRVAYCVSPTCPARAASGHSVRTRFFPWTHFHCGLGRWGAWVCWSRALVPWRAGRWGRGYVSPPSTLLLPRRTPQVRLERIRQAESLEQVRSIMDEAPLRDIRDIQDT